MDFLMEWQFWFAFVNLLAVAGLGLFNYMSHNKLVSNDLYHLSTDVKKISDNQEDLSEKVGVLAENVGYLRGRIEVRTKQYAKKKLKV